MCRRTWAVLMLCVTFAAVGAPAKRISQPEDIQVDTGPKAPAIRLKKSAKTPDVPVVPTHGATATSAPNSSTPVGEDKSPGVRKMSRKKAVNAGDMLPDESAPGPAKRSKKTMKDEGILPGETAGTVPSVKKTPAAPRTSAMQPSAPASAAPQGATAQCKDGSFSLSRQHRGACSRHGGVASWLQN